MMRYCLDQRRASCHVFPEESGNRLISEIAEPSGKYGGSWTIEKLEILRRYLDAYTTALKKQPFRLMYVDAFAGTGRVDLPASESAVSGFLAGSARIALQIVDKPFDQLIFIDNNPDYCASLERLSREHGTRNIRIENCEANDFLQEFSRDWREWRGVLFLDPFATQVEWSTIETIAEWEALDTWILFPVSAIARILPLSRKPDDILEKWAKRLTRVFGDESWRDLYRQNPQGDLFGDSTNQRDSGIDGIVRIYKTKLIDTFGPRALEDSRTLRNPENNSPLFEIMFCVGHPNGIGPATNIARHLLNRI